MQSLDIFNELSEHIFIKINSCQKCSHEEFWGETRIHKDYDIWYVESGTVFIRENNIVHAAYEGDFVLFYPNIPYETYTDNNTCQLIYLHFDFAIGHNWRILNDFNFSGIINSKNFTEEKALFLKGYNEYENKLPMSSLFLKGSLTAVLSCFIKESPINSVIFVGNIKNNNSDNILLLKPVLDYISANLDKKLTIAELANKINFSEKYFIHFFKNTLGISPMQYVNQLKMNQARKYIYNGNYTIKQLSDILGYTDQYSFSKAFKKHFKVSPSQFK